MKEKKMLVEIKRTESALLLGPNSHFGFLVRAPSQKNTPIALDT